MKLYKPKFWDHKNLISFSLFPLSLIIQLIIFFKKKFSKVSILKYLLYALEIFMLVEQEKHHCLFLVFKRIIKNWKETSNYKKVLQRT